MLHALGFSDTPFDLSSPGRLCRGRERWIESWETPEETAAVRRVVISGAAFTDDSAADARRGVTESGVDLASVITALFPRKTLLAFMEDGHPADIPAGAEGIEAYEGHRAGGRSELGLVRWHLRVSGVTAIRALVRGAHPEAQVRGFAVIPRDTDDDALMERIFPLVGFSTLDSPPAHYQPAALPSILEQASAVLLLHRDKHGPALGIYQAQPIPGLADKLARLSRAADALLVPFAIPPMLARWDRALSDLREVWSESHTEPFPVPVAPASAHQDRRRGRRRGRRDRSAEVAPTSDDATPPPTKPEEPVATAEPPQAAASEE